VSLAGDGESCAGGLPGGWAPGLLANARAFSHTHEAEVLALGGPPREECYATSLQNRARLRFAKRNDPHYHTKTEACLLAFLSCLGNNAQQI
jgi:hypothetical protein